MKPFIKCKINYFYSPHLSQIYTGFDLLKQRGIIDLTWVKAKTNIDTTKPLLKVEVNNKYDVIFDTLDGMNWIDGSIEDNLKYFKNKIQADFYFKRSFDQNIVKYSPDNCRVYPLGFNYCISENCYLKNVNIKIKEYIENIKIIRIILKRGERKLLANDYEYYPIPNKITKVLFLTRLWDPSLVVDDRLKKEREDINHHRIDCIRACKREYKDIFTGGIPDNSFSRKNATDLIALFSVTNKESYIDIVKGHNICITDTGLHNSVGWKFGEYVAASRAIISENMCYEQPGSFRNGINFLEYKNCDELIEKINYLIERKAVLLEMMKSNYEYYNNYLRPDMLVLNALLTIASDF